MKTSLKYRENNANRYIIPVTIIPKDKKAVVRKNENNIEYYKLLPKGSESLSKISFMLNGEKYFLQKSTPNVILINYGYTSEILWFENGNLQKSELKFYYPNLTYFYISNIQYVKELGIFFTGLHVAGKSHQGPWWSGISYTDYLCYLGMSTSGTDFYFTSVNFAYQPSLFFFDKNDYKMYVGFYHLASDRSIVTPYERSSCYEFDYVKKSLNISSSILTGCNYIQQNKALAGYQLTAKNGKILFCTPQGYPKNQSIISFPDNYIFHKSYVDYKLYYNEKLLRFFVKGSNGECFFCDENSDIYNYNNWIKCSKNDIFISYGHVGIYEIIDDNALSLDGKSKDIILKASLANLHPASICYDPFSNKYLYAVKINNSINFYETTDFKTETLIKTTKAGSVIFTGYFSADQR